MPYTITRESQGVYVKWAGAISGAEFLASVHEVNQSPDFHSFRYVINDTLDCPGVELSSLIMEDAIAGAIGAHASNPQFVAAFVAREPAVVAAWTAVASVANDYLKTSVFTDVESARRWVAAAQGD